MTDQWYYTRVEPRLGPFTADQLKELAASGQIRPHDTVWKEGVVLGVPASKVKHLFEGIPPIPPEAVNYLLPAAKLPDIMPPEIIPPEIEVPPTPHVYSDPNDMEIADGEREQWKPSAEAEPEPAKSEKPAAPKAPAPKLKRVLSVKGGSVVSQDGLVVKFRKQCLRCSYADTNVATMPIRNGITRVNFFCPKCKKSQQVEVQGLG